MLLREGRNEKNRKKRAEEAAERKVHWEEREALRREECQRLIVKGRALEEEAKRWIAKETAEPTTLSSSSSVSLPTTESVASSSVLSLLATESVASSIVLSSSSSVSLPTTATTNVTGIRYYRCEICNHAIKGRAGNRVCNNEESCERQRKKWNIKSLVSHLKIRDDNRAEQDDETKKYLTIKSVNNESEFKNFL